MHEVHVFYWFINSVIIDLAKQVRLLLSEEDQLELDQLAVVATQSAGEADRGDAMNRSGWNEIKVGLAPPTHSYNYVMCSIGKTGWNSGGRVPVLWGKDDKLY